MSLQIKSEQKIIQSKKQSSESGILTRTPAKKWLWIELIGFDWEKKDFGVKEYINNVGFVPEMLSFLFSSPDFIHQHEPLTKEIELSWNICTYGGRNDGKKNVEDLPRWTNLMLKKLIAELHKYKIKVFCCVFSRYRQNKFHNEWVRNHQELLSVNSDGVCDSFINPLARFNTGEYYEDFFIGKLLDVVKDYDFDGFHMDGRNHYPLSLCATDYSDNMVGQFTENQNLDLPNNIAEQIVPRAKWIWQHKRMEWIEFHVGRWETHIKKIVDKMHAVGKEVIFHTSWSRDPFEAVYRYGIDYVKIAKTGMDYFIQECPAGGNESGAEFGMNDNFFPNFFYKILATILLTKASVRDSNIIALHHIHDMMEDYEVLRHLPTFLQKEGYFYPNLFYIDKEGKLDRCIQGFMICLANGICHEDWKWMQRNWQNSFAIIPKSIRGATVVWSERMLENQLRDYISTRTAPTHTLLWRLLLKGAPIFSSTNIENIDKVEGPIVVLNHHLFPDDEIKRIMDFKNGVKVLIGKGDSSGVSPDFEFSDVYPPDQLSLRIYDSLQKFTVKIEDDVVEDISKDFTEVEDPLYYCQDIYSRKISESFLRESAKVISQLAGNVKITNSSEATILTMEKGKGEFRLFIGNNKYTYSHPEIDMGSDIANIETVTEFPYKTIIPDGSKFIVRVPGKGIVVLDVTLNDKK